MEVKRYKRDFYNNMPKWWIVTAEKILADRDWFREFDEAWEELRQDVLHYHEFGGYRPEFDKYFGHRDLRRIH